MDKKYDNCKRSSMLLCYLGSPGYLNTFLPQSHQCGEGGPGEGTAGLGRPLLAPPEMVPPAMWPLGSAGPCVTQLGTSE